MVVAEEFEQTQEYLFGLSVAMVFVLPQNAEQTVQGDQDFAFFRHAQSVPESRFPHVLENKLV